MIEIFTDGSSTKNGSGFGYVVLKDGTKIYEKSEHFKDGTNQAMELSAAIAGCKYSDTIREDDFGQEQIIIYSDSAYLVNCANDKWYVTWLNNGWKNSKKEDVANKDLWQQLLPYFTNPSFEFKKVAGHSGHIYNERADRLATGKASVNDADDLTTYKKYDTINIELSELLIKYKLNTLSTQQTIKEILQIMIREGVNLRG